MTDVTIFGTGAMGTAIGAIVSAGGRNVQHIGSDAHDAMVEGGVVVLAVPYPALASIVEHYGPQLAGKTVVDITNPLDFATFDALVVPADGSAASELVAKLPQSAVLKAFNTNFAATLATGAVGGQRPTVLVAGDDTAAKEALIGVVTASGQVDAVDAGSLSRARELEALGFLQLTLAVQERVAWTGGFALVR